MAQLQPIDTTTLQPNGDRGDPAKTAFEKVNFNFAALQAAADMSDIAVTANQALFYNGSTWQVYGLSAFARTLLARATAALMRGDLGAVGTSGNETVGGNKNFTGNNTYTGINTFSGQVLVPAVGDVVNLVADRGQNMIPNGNWLQNKDYGWTYTGSNQDVVATEGRNGGTAWKVSGLAGPVTRSAYAAGRRNIAVSPGRTYRISCWYKTDAAYNGATADSKLRVSDQNDALIVGMLLPGFSANVTNFTLAQVVYTVVPGASAVQAIRVSVGSNNTAGNLWISEVRVDDITEEVAVGVDVTAAANAAAAAQTTANTANTTANLALGRAAKNYLINGDFRFWQRGTSFGPAVYTADRWYFNTGGVATPTLTQNPIPLGTAGISAPAYAKISYGTITGGANHFVVFEQRIEGVDTFAGKTATVSFKVFNSGAAGRQIAVEIQQFFGAGSSATVTGIGSKKYALAVGLNVIVHTVQIPSVSGKSAGASNCLTLTLWATGGSNFNARNDSLGNQVGDVHFTEVQAESGSTATEFEFRPDAIELALCQRYYEKSYDLSVVPGSPSAFGRRGEFIGVLPRTAGNSLSVPLLVAKRATPSVTVYASENGQVNSVSQASGTSVTINGMSAVGHSAFQITYTNGSGEYGGSFHYTADAEL